MLLMLVLAQCPGRLDLISMSLELSGLEWTEYKRTETVAQARPAKQY
jgi:hypothetical protein